MSSRRNSSRSRNDDGKKRRLHGARILPPCGPGKASPALVENVDVEAYGSTMKLKQLALITTPEPRLLVVQPFDAEHGAEHRESAERIEDRHYAGGGWKNHSAADSGAIGRAAQGSGAFAQANGGGSARAGAREPSRRAG